MTHNKQEMTRKKQITLRVSEDLHGALKEMSRGMGVSMSEYIIFRLLPQNKEFIHHTSDVLRGGSFQIQKYTLL